MFNAKLEIEYEDQTKDCIYFDDATSRINGRLVYFVPSIPNNQDFNFSFSIASIYPVDADCNEFAMCSERLPQCCLTPEVFDCCACGFWENELETFSFKFRSSAKKGSIGITHYVSSRPDRIPGFTSAVQINSEEHGCQCCTY